MESVGERLRLQRKRNSLTLGQVAEYENLSKGYLSDLERGVNAPPAWPLLARLTQRYKTSADYLLGLTDDPRPTATLQLDPETQNLVRQIIADFATLSARDQRMALDFLRMMRQAEDDTREPLVPRIIGQE